MGDNRSNMVFRWSGIAVRFAFVSVLLCSVAMPYQVLAADDVSADLNDGTELRTALLQGLSSIVLTSKGDASGGFSIPNPGQEFRNKVYRDKTWLTAENYDLSFMGEVTFQDGFFVQKPAFAVRGDEYSTNLAVKPNDNPITSFLGGAINNSGNLEFVGKSIAFVDNTIDAATKFKQQASAVTARGAGVYNEKSMTVASDTTALFDGNTIVSGASGSEGYALSLSQGAGVYNQGELNFLGSVTFKDNIVSQEWIHAAVPTQSDGAGLYNEKDVTFAQSATFSGNKAENGVFSRGAGLYNAGTDYVNNENTSGGESVSIPTVHFKGLTTFVNNLSTTQDRYAYGAGAFNMKGKLLFDGITVFSGNKAELNDDMLGAVAAGAGLYTLGKYSEVEFNGATNFTGNSVTSFGEQSTGNGAGVYLADGRLTFNNTVSFYGNTINANQGYSYGEGGAMQTLGADAVATFNGDATFEGNKISASTYSVGGAIANYASVNFNPDADGASTIIFRGNEVKNLIAEDQYTSEELKQHNVHFIQARGGALYNAEGNTTFAKGTTVLFEGNKAVSQNATAFGGAVYNEVFANDTGRVNFNGDAYFRNNEATTGGGAIFNKGVMLLDGTTEFVGNKAQLGGAVYNDAGALMTIAGSKVVFKNNTADLGSNIYNLGTVNIQNVKDTMAVNYSPYTDAPYPQNGHTLFDQSGDVYNAGTINILDSTLQLWTGINNKQTENKKIGTLNLNNSIVDLGTSTIYTGDFNVNHNSKVITHIGDSSHGNVVAGNSIGISNAGTTLQVIVDVDGIQKGEVKEYRLFKVEPDTATADEGTPASSGITGNFASIADNYMYSIREKEGEKGVYLIERGSTTGGGSQGGSGAVTPSKPVNPYCPSGDCENYNKDASEAWIDGGKMDENKDATAVRAGLHELAQVQGFDSQDYQDAMNQITPDTSSLITAHANEITRQISNAIGKRFYSSMERSHYVYNGKIHYKAPRQTSNIWVEGLYSQAEYDGKNKWDMDSYGLAAGIETKLTKELKVGAMLAFTSGDGGTDSRDTEIETTAGAIYAEYSPSRFYTNAFALYGTSKVKEDRTVFSTKVESEFDVNVIAAQAIAGYKLGPVVVGNWVSGVISPEIGLRYVYAKQKEYEDSLGQTIESTDSHTLTGILGARYTLGYRLAPNMWFYPELRAALTYDFITPTMDTNVVLLNGASYAYETEEMDRFGVEIGVKMGLELDKRTEIGLEYEGLLKGDYTNHTGIANVKYHF